MGSAFDRLQRVLKLEAQKGYKDDAVVGGLQAFAAVWVGQDEAAEADIFLIEQITQQLASYHNLSGMEARRQMVDHMLKNVSNRMVVPSFENENETKKIEQKDRKPKSTPKKKKKNLQKNDLTDLDQSVQYLKGVGPRVAELLGNLGIETVGELLVHHPRRYDDYSKMLPIRELKYGQIVSVIGTVWTVQTRNMRGNKTMIHAVLGDGTGKVQLTWFNQPWLVNKLKGGAQIVVSGKVDQYLGRPTFNNPEWELVSEDQLTKGRIVPIYPLTKGLGAGRIRTIMETAVNKYARDIPDPLPTAVCQRQHLIPLGDAMRYIHLPSDQKQLRQAQRRLMFDEMFLLQLGMLGQRREWEQKPAKPLTASEAERIKLYNLLPFELTKAQRRSVREITADMNRPTPMNRLLQGDVGSGKTLVAASAIVHAVKSGVQAAIMAPTEILAEQHHRGLSKLLEPLGISLRLLTGRMSAGEKEQVCMEAEMGAADVFIGTTALIQPNVTFKNLGFVVIDEQHRFGVDQRGALRDKGIVEQNPHLLVMTATPIPRSLALSLYGDLDLSVIDEMPPGRQEILTRWLRSTERRRATNFIRKEVKAGRQAYIIYPLVEESEKLDDVKAAVEEHERLQREEFPNLRLGLLHGRMKSAEKEAVMRQFYAHELDVLISTTVIEVGIDVPNATIIVIESANRFGLAQLHQLRGRVGRGQHASYCILIADSNSETAEQRLKALEDTNDGFQLAETDLRLRGPGEFFGRRQSGIPELQLASLLDTSLLKVTQEEARGVYKSDPDLARPEHALLKQKVMQFWDNAGDVS